MSVKRKIITKIIITNNNNKKKPTCTKQIFINLFFQRILRVCATTNDPASMHHFPRCKDYWVAVILALNLFHLFSFFRKVCTIDVASLRPNIYHAFENNASLFFEKVFLKCAFPADDSLQQHKTVLHFAKYFFLLVV